MMSLLRVCIYTGIVDADLAIICIAFLSFPDRIGGQSS